ncbi:putative non-specific serine/threonine protein kinase [Helianthus debilis subsp. tardiflorus]
MQLHLVMREAKRFITLIIFAYERWQGKETRQMIDPCLTNEPYSIERITRCIHIALLCIQEDRKSRPHTSSVVDWLNNSFDTPYRCS